MVSVCLTCSHPLSAWTMHHVPSTMVKMPLLAHHNATCLNYMSAIQIYLREYFASWAETCGVGPGVAVLDIPSHRHNSNVQTCTCNSVTEFLCVWVYILSMWSTEFWLVSFRREDGNCAWVVLQLVVHLVFNCDHVRKNITKQSQWNPLLTSSSSPCVKRWN